MHLHMFSLFSEIKLTEPLPVALIKFGQLCDHMTDILVLVSCRPRPLLEYPTAIHFILV